MLRRKKCSLDLCQHSDALAMTNFLFGGLEQYGLEIHPETTTNNSQLAAGIKLRITE